MQTEIHRFREKHLRKPEGALPSPTITMDLPNTISYHNTAMVDKIAMTTMKTLAALEITKIRTTPPGEKIVFLERITKPTKLSKETITSDEQNENVNLSANKISCHSRRFNV